MKRKSKVLIGMSGGVDSSVAAVLLKEKGFDVTGCFMTFEKKDNRCCSVENRRKAEEVARMIKIPFYCLDFEKEFKKRIINEFIEGYKKGITPNPCVECNKEIKFGLFLKKALALNFDYIATGHYARLKKTTNRTVRLFKGIDKEKDQSYFLWKLGQKELKKIIFPLGDYTKKEVRGLAKKFNLPVWNAKESQEVCFIKKSTSEFFKKHIKKKEGDIFDINGDKLGKHQGLHFYTIGQRKGINLPGGPFFVVRKDVENNHLIVSKKENHLLNKEISLVNINWISGKPFDFSEKIKAQIRYRHQPASASLVGRRLIFDKPQRAITPGQSVVFYKRNELLGGGIIKD